MSTPLVIFVISIVGLVASSTPFFHRQQNEGSQSGFTSPLEVVSQVCQLACFVSGAVAGWMLLP